MRAVRFAAQLGYGLAPATRRAIPAALPVVRKVAVERISEELGRLVVAPDARRARSASCARPGSSASSSPRSPRCPAAAQVHATRVLAAVPPDAALRFAALLHPLGADAAERILVELRQPRRVSDEVAALLRGHACRLGARAAVLPRTQVEVRRYLSRTGPGAGGVARSRSQRARPRPPRPVTFARRAAR